MRMNGFNNCIAGIVERFGQPDIVCYDKEKVLDQLQVEGMSYDDSVEWFYHNQLGAWVGDATPCFLTQDTDPPIFEETQ